MGVRTNQPFLLQLLDSAAFRTGQTFTHTVHSTTWPAVPVPAAVLAAGRAALQAAPRRAQAGPTPTGAGVGHDVHSPWDTLGNFRMGPCGS